MESILTSIKKLLGVGEDYEEFDTDIIMHINSVLMILNQLGVGPPKGFFITGSSETWYDFLGDKISIESVKTYVYMKVKLIFDPPLNSAAINSMTSLINELEWRIQIAAESVENTSTGEDDNFNVNCCDKDGDGDCDCVVFMKDSEITEIFTGEYIGDDKNTDNEDAMPSDSCNVCDQDNNGDCDCIDFLTESEVFEIFDS